MIQLTAVLYFTCRIRKCPRSPRNYNKTALLCIFIHILQHVSSTPSPDTCNNSSLSQEDFKLFGSFSKLLEHRQPLAKLFDIACSGDSEVWDTVHKELVIVGHLGRYIQERIPRRDDLKAKRPANPPERQYVVLGQPVLIGTASNSKSVPFIGSLNPTSASITLGSNKLSDRECKSVTPKINLKHIDIIKSNGLLLDITARLDGCEETIHQLIVTDYICDCHREKNIVTPSKSAEVSTNNSTTVKAADMETVPIGETFFHASTTTSNIANISGTNTSSDTTTSTEVLITNGTKPSSEVEATNGTTTAPNTSTSCHTCVHASNNITSEIRILTKQMVDIQSKIKSATEELLKNIMDQKALEKAKALTQTLQNLLIKFQVILDNLQDIQGLPRIRVVPSFLKIFNVRSLRGVYVDQEEVFCHEDRSNLSISFATIDDALLSLASDPTNSSKANKLYCSSNHLVEAASQILQGPEELQRNLFEAADLATLTKSKTEYALHIVEKEKDANENKHKTLGQEILELSIQSKYIENRMIELQKGIEK